MKCVCSFSVLLDEDQKAGPTHRTPSPHRTNFFPKKKFFEKLFLKMNHMINLEKTKSFFINTFKRYRLNTILIYTGFHRKPKHFIFKKHVYLILGQKMGKKCRENKKESV